MSVNSAYVIDLFKDHTSGVGDTLSDGAIQDRLVDFHVHVIPGEVDGPLFEHEWMFQFTDLNSSIIMSDSINSTHARVAWLLPISGTTPDSRDRKRIPVTYDYDAFVREYPDHDSGVVDDLEAICISTDTIYFNAKPKLESGFTSHGLFLTVRALAQWPTTAAGSVRLTPVTIPSTGMTYLEAQAVASGAARDYLFEIEDADGATREQAYYDRYISLLRQKSNSYRKIRRPKRTF